MTPEDWRLLRQIFEDALSLPEAEREPFVKARCGGNAELCAETLAMLRADGNPQRILKPGLEPNLETFAGQVFEPGDDPYLDHTFHQYRFVERLAIGGMGWVYRAVHLDHGGNVAIKLLYDRMSLERRQLFEVEKNRLAELNHPFIARLYDAGILDDGAAFFVMEYVNGAALDDYCRKGRVSIAGRLALFRQICEAVHYLHRRGIVHCDLKPANILVQEDGVVKLIDLGISERENDASKLPPSAGYMTLAYAAPEQVLKAPISTQTDIYSLGALLYQLVTGSMPFEVEGKSLHEIKGAIFHQIPSRPSIVVKQLEAVSAMLPLAQATGMAAGIRFSDLGALDWGDIDALCATALAEDPSVRYGSVESLMRDLDNMANKKPLDRRAGRRYRAARFLQRNKLGTALTAAALLLIAAIVTGYTISLKRALSRERAEATRTRRVESFLETIITGDDPNNGPSGGLTVAEVLNRAVKEVQTLTSDPPLQAALNEELGTIYAQSGNFPVAESLLQTALQTKTRLYASDSSEMAETWRNLATLRLNEGKLEEAKGLATRALAIDRRKLSESNPQTAEAGILLGEILNAGGDYKEAASVLERVLRYETSKDDRPYDLSAALSNLSNAYFYLGRFDDAEKLLLRSVEIDRQIKGDTNLDMASDLMSLGTLYGRTNRLPQAEAAERRALAINQNWFEKKDRPETAATMVMLAETLSNQGKNAEALEIATQGLAMYINLKQLPTTGYAHAWNAVGLIQDELGNHAEAEKDFTQSLAIYKIVLSSPNFQIGMVLDNMAVNSAKLKEYSRAEEYSRQSLQMLKATLPADDLSIPTTEVHYAEILYADHRPGEAEVQLQSALAVLSSDGNAPRSDLDYVNAELALLAREKAAHKTGAPVAPSNQNKKEPSR